MIFDQKKFEKGVPSFFSRLLDVLASFGFIPTLVGGTVRDFYLTGVVGKDWDVELSHATLAFNKDQWKTLGKSLSDFGKISYLPYDIIRLEADGFQLEFSPPRIETFLPEVNHHSNFTVEFDFKLPFEKAVLRRDFTINAMGLRFKSKKEFELLDPLQGLRHLREKCLHPAGPDFSKDPVRFLRAHRFAEKLGLTFSPELEAQLKIMNVTGWTHAYLWSEMQKSKDPISYLERLLKASFKHPEMKLPLPTDSLKLFPELRKVLRDPSMHECWIIALTWVGIPGEAWRDYFNLSSDTSKRLARWAQTSRYFEKHLPEAFHEEFEKVRETEDFEKLFDWYFTTKQLLGKNPNLPLMKMIEEYLPDWIHLYRFEAPKDVKHIDPPYRAKYQVWNLCQRL